MKKMVYVIMLFSFLMSLSSVASAGKYGIGAFGGVNIPVVQQDEKAGALFGAKARIPLLPFLAIEPNFTLAQFRGNDFEVGEQSFTMADGDITSFGVDLVIGTMSSMSKMKFYGLVGLNSNTFKREEFKKTGLGLTLGPGFEFFATEMLSVEVRARYHAIKVGEGGKSHLELSGGLNYYFGKE
jgi:hypothetical protein